LTVVLTASDVATAAADVQRAVHAVNFTGKTYRTDIALKALQPRSVLLRCFMYLVYASYNRLNI